MKPLMAPRGLMTDQKKKAMYNQGVVRTARRMTKGVLTDMDIKRAEAIYNPQRNFASSRIGRLIK